MWEHALFPAFSGRLLLLEEVMTTVWSKGLCSQRPPPSADAWSGSMLGLVYKIPGFLQLCGPRFRPIQRSEVMLSSWAFTCSAVFAECAALLKCLLRCGRSLAVGRRNYRTKGPLCTPTSHDCSILPAEWLCWFTLCNNGGIFSLLLWPFNTTSDQLLPEITHPKELEEAFLLLVWTPLTAGTKPDFGLL